MSQVNLLPPEVRQKIKLRRLTIGIGLAGSGVIALLILFWVAQGVTLQRVERETTAQEATNAELTTQVNDLQVYQDLEDQLTSRDTLVASALENEVSWSSVLRDVQLIIPDRIGLSSFTGSINEAGNAGEEEEVGIIGEMEFGGQSEGTLRLARWIARQTEVNGWANPWLSSATETEEFSNQYEFSSTVDLLTGATTPRGKGPTGTEAGA
ncbi:MAG: hypothetical protein WD004_07390 [Actinomycetota bacterium]